MIKQILEGKSFIFNDNNNNKQVLDNIAKEIYTHIFISPKIVISKKFKNNVIGPTFFTRCFILFVIDKINFVKK